MDGRLQAGTDPEAGMAAIVERHKDLLVDFLFQMTGSRDQAVEFALQIAVMLGRPKILEVVRPDPRPWLVKEATRRVLRLERGRRLRRLFFPVKRRRPPALRKGGHPRRRGPLMGTDGGGTSPARSSWLHRTEPPASARPERCHGDRHGRGCTSDRALAPGAPDASGTRSGLLHFRTCGDPRRMTMGARHRRPEKEDRHSTDLKPLERMRAPWFFDAEVQRRVRMGDPSRRASRWRRLKIAAAYFVLAACLVVAYLDVRRPSAGIDDATRTTDSPPDGHPGDTATHRYSKGRTGGRCTTDHNEDPDLFVAGLGTRSGGGQCTTDSARADSVSPASPSQRALIQESPPTDTTRPTEPQRSVTRPDTTLVEPDSLGHPRGTP